MGAFAGEFSDDDLKMLRSDSRVAAIEEDGVMNALANVTQYVPPLFDLIRHAASTGVHETQSGSTLLGA